jgi:NUMOD3 motif
LALEISLIAAIGREVNGGPLVNLTDGGEGITGHRHGPATRAKMSARVHSEESRQLRRSYRHTPEARRKISIAQTGKKRGEKQIANMSAAQKKRGNVFTREHMLKFAAAGAAATRGKPKTEQHRAKLSAARRRVVERKRKEEAGPWPTDSGQLPLLL